MIANDERRIIVEAMNQLMDILAIQKSASGPKRLCVYFRPARPTDSQHLLVQYGGGCSASVGYNSHSDNTMNLSPTGCFHRGIIQHELLHNLGTCVSIDDLETFEANSSMSIVL